MIGTGASHSVNDFLLATMAAMADLGPAANVPQTVDEWVEINPQFLRVGEIHDLRADARLANVELNWKPQVGFTQLVRMMVGTDLALARGNRRRRNVL